MSTIGSTTTDHCALRARTAGDVIGPADQGWDSARQAWHLPSTSGPPPSRCPATRAT